MNRIVSATGFLLFAGVSFVHFSGLWRIVAQLWPALGLVAAAGFTAIWAAGLGILVQALRHNRLKPAFATVFVYVMLVMVAGMRFLAGVPATVKSANWRDPDNLLTPQAEYLLHNHGAVSKVISREEFVLYSQAVTCYFTAAGMLFAAALCLKAVDRDNQLGTSKPRRFGAPPQFG
jgi:hypothetical protein